MQLCESEDQASYLRDLAKVSVANSVAIAQVRSSRDILAEHCFHDDSTHMLSLGIVFLSRLSATWLMAGH